MAPSIAEAPKANVVVPVKTDTVETKPKIRRAIDEEGGTTTASVSA
jgi:taurine dioxygenase/sulfonate dioxygenase